MQFQNWRIWEAMNKNVFRSVPDEEMKFLYTQIIESRETGLRPKCLDDFIVKFQELYPLPTASAWKYAEESFFNEVARRYFEGEEK